MTHVQVQRWPGVAEWLVAFAASGMIAAEVQTKADLYRLQSSTAYYFDSPWVPALHWAGLAVNACVIALVMVWMVSPIKGTVRTLLGAMAAAGAVLCWVELVYALKLQQGAVYALLDLPLRPINNLGVIGAQVFGTYLILRSPTERLRGWRWWLVSAGLSLGLWLFQNVLWGMVS